MGNAEFIKRIEPLVGDGRLYRLSKSVQWDDNGKKRRTRFVLVSAVIAYSGAETYLFPANKRGDVLDWGELGGSYRGGLSHEAALRNAGFEIV